MGVSGQWSSVTAWSASLQSTFLSSHNEDGDEGISPHYQHDVVVCTHNILLSHHQDLIPETPGHHHSLQLRCLKEYFVSNSLNANDQSFHFSAIEIVAM